MRAAAIGLSHQPALADLIAARGDLVEIVEIEPQTYWIKAPQPGAPPRGNRLVLDELTALPQPKLLHGIGAPLGGTVCDQSWHVALFREWADALGVAWSSEHLSFNEHAGGVAGFLLPPAQSDDAVALAARNIRARAAALAMPIAFETGVNYYPPTAGETPDDVFFADVAEAADCGILLDLHNLWCNECNGRARVADVLARLPLDRVWEVHVAGGHRHRGRRLDAHSGATPAAVLGMLADLLPDLPRLEAIIFEIGASYVPAFGEAGVLAELERLHAIRARAAAPRRCSPRPPAERPSATSDPQAWEAMIAAAIADPEAGSTDALYAELIGAFRAGALADLLRRTCLLLVQRLGRKRADALLAAFAAEVPPACFPTDEALHFAAWLRARGIDDPHLADMLRFEAALIDALASDHPARVTLAHDLSKLIAAIDAGEAPDLPADGPYELVIG